MFFFVIFLIHSSKVLTFEFRNVLQALLPFIGDVGPRGRGVYVGMNNYMHIIFVSLSLSIYICICIVILYIYIYAHICIYYMIIY